MRESAEASIHMFENSHENPELVWDDDARTKVQSVVTRMKTEFYEVFIFIYLFISKKKQN